MSVPNELLSNNPLLANFQKQLFRLDLPAHRLFSVWQYFMMHGALTSHPLVRQRGSVEEFLAHGADQDLAQVRADLCANPVYIEFLQLK